MDPLTMMILSGLFGGGAAGFSAFGAANANREKANRAAIIRNKLDSVISNLRSPDYSLLNSAASREYSQTADAAQANAASRGITGGAASKGQSNNILAQAMANLAQLKVQDQANRETNIASILGNEAYGVPEASTVNPGLEALLAFLGGSLGNAGTALLTQLANPKVDDGKTPPPAADYAPAPFGVQLQGQAAPAASLQAGIPSATSPYGVTTAQLSGIGQSVVDPYANGLNFLGLLGMKRQAPAASPYIPTDKASEIYARLGLRQAPAASPYIPTPINYSPYAPRRY